MKNIALGTLILMMAATSSSCITDPVWRVEPGPTDGEVTFRISVPGVRNPSTRVLLPEQEYAIDVNDIHVLMFRQNPDSFVGCFQGRVVGGGTGGSTTPRQGGATLDFEVTLPLGARCNLMVVANAKSILQSHSDVLVRESTQAEVEATLTAAMSSSGWPTGEGDGSGAALLPMWGYATGVETCDFTAGAAENAYIFRKEISLVRMLSKVDVMLEGSFALVPADAPGSEDKKKFSLSEVYVYNYNTTGRLIPDTGLFPWDDFTTEEFRGHKTPSLPRDVAAASPGQAIRREVADERSLTGGIYLFEALAGVSPMQDIDAFRGNPCLVVGGKYNGSEQITYYRIDFAVRDGDNKWKYVPLIRNNSYTVIIHGVSSPGATTPEDTLNSVPENIDAAVVEWNNSDMTDIVFDGVNMLAVSQGRFEFSREARAAGDTDNLLRITTDVQPVGGNPGGWGALVYNDEAGSDLLSDGSGKNGWLRLSTYSGTGNYPDGNEVWLLADENDTGATRTAYIRIGAGRLTYIVRVKQDTAAEMSLEVMRNTYYDYTTRYFAVSEMNLGSSEVENYDMQIKWRPVDAIVHCTFTEKATSGSSEYGLVEHTNLPADGRITGNAPYIYRHPVYMVNNRPKEYTVPAGEHYFTLFTSDAFSTATDPFAEKSGRLDFEIVTESGSLTRSLLVRQKKDNIIPLTDDYYLMDGTTDHKIRVKANFPWKVALAAGGDPAGVVSEFGVQYGGGKGYKEDYIRFKLIDNLTAIDESKLTATVRFRFWRLDERGAWVDWKDWKGDTFTPGETVREYSLNCVAAVPVGPANCYMVKPGGAPIMIPLSIARNSFTQTLSASSAFSEHLVWTDNPGGLDASGGSCIRRLVPVGANRGYQGHLIVIPGNAEGNSVVAVKDGGKIAWSWHIWSTRYDPDEQTGGRTYSFGGFTWMDRNLGSNRAAPGDNDPEIYGLYYQWGRKDPFPRPAKWGSRETYQETEPIYNANGVPLTFAVKGSGRTGTGIMIARESSTVENSIRTPMTFYSQGTADAFWMGRYNLNVGFWGHETAAKGPFDPCPEGWRVPDTDGRIGMPASPWAGHKSAETVDNCLYFAASGYWPLGGYMHGEGKPHVLTNTTGLCWTAGQEEPDRTGADGSEFCRFKYYPNKTLNYEGDDSDFGFNVRCVKEKKSRR